MMCSKDVNVQRKATGENLHQFQMEGNNIPAVKNDL